MCPECALLCRRTKNVVAYVPQSIRQPETARDRTRDDLMPIQSTAGQGPLVPVAAPGLGRPAAVCSPMESPGQAARLCFTCTATGDTVPVKSLAYQRLRASPTEACSPLLACNYLQKAPMQTAGHLNGGLGTGPVQAPVRFTLLPPGQKSARLKRLPHAYTQGLPPGNFKKSQHRPRAQNAAPQHVRNDSPRPHAEETIKTQNFTPLRESASWTLLCTPTKQRKAKTTTL
jgi:hypothetical protein